jgi:lipopolysaccharide transport system ATP-binding protein
VAAAIEVSAVGKEYRVGEREAHNTVRDSIATATRASVDMLRRRRNGAAVAPRPDSFWALSDVSMRIQSGEVVGLIGRNGAGKSTLLKLLARVTEPTTGRIILRGRVGSLLEVGTGFHSELTGRENTFLSGAILGMTRNEIRRNFDRIVAFAEVERFIDTPVKHYSSGMYTRLAFAVAAHLEPEILLVDEVLAVGDAQFQRRCMGKMNEVAGEGRTVVFVSHNMTAINQLCRRTVLLENGRVAQDGPTHAVVGEYLRVATESTGETVWDDPATAPGNGRARLHAVRVVSGGLPRGTVNIDEEVTIEVEYWNFDDGARSLGVDVYLVDATANVVFSSATTPGANAGDERWFERPHPRGLYRSRCTIPANFLNDGTYYISAYVFRLGYGVEAQGSEAIGFSVFDTGVMRLPGGGREWPGVIRPRLHWETELVDGAE